MLLNFFKQFFVIDDAEHESGNLHNFHVSALRILLSTSLLVASAFTLHSIFRIDGTDDAFMLSAVGAACSLVLITLLCTSKRFNRQSSFLLIVALAVTGVLFIRYSEHPNGIEFGVILLYSLPLLARLFYSFKVSLLFAFANTATLAMDLHVSERLPFESGANALFSDLYAQLMVFTLLNFALPLAVSRLIKTLQRSIHRLKELTNSVSHHSDLYEEIFEHTGTPTLLCDKRGVIIKLNQKALDLFPGVNPETIEGSKINDWISSISDSSNRFFWQSNVSECVLKSNTRNSLEVHRSSLTTHGHYVLHLQDVTHLRALTEKLENTQQTNSQLVHYDALTQLPNQQKFCNQVNHRIHNVSDYYTGAMFIIRISQFKLLNKQYGREQANRVILNFSRTLQSRLSDKTISGRLRGVKFACFMPVGQTYLIQRNLRTLIKSVLPEQIRIGEDILNIDYQIGVAYYQNEGETAEELLERCEMALEYSTSAERIAFFDKQLETKLIQEHKLGLALGEAVKNKKIQLWLQPQVVSSGDIRSFEALSRWQLEDGTFISPIVFIKLAEELGLLPKLAENLLKQLVAVLEEWHAESIKTPIAFNLAGQELMNDVFFALLMSMTSERPWLSEMLELEITETSPVMTHPLIHKRLRALSQYGYSIAIDDFGTGQASLGQLIDIPASILKIDRRFVAPLPNDNRHLDIVKSTIQLARSLNMSVIAEGIETREQANLLIGLGCDTLQGYYFGKPSPISDWTKNNHEKAKQLRMVY